MQAFLFHQYRTCPVVSSSSHHELTSILARRTWRALAASAIALLTVGHAATAAEATFWRAGVAKVKITPQGPYFAAGYGGEKRIATEKHHDLWIKVLALEDARGQRGLLITSDICGFDRVSYNAICTGLKQRCGLDRADHPQFNAQPLGPRNSQLPDALPRFYAGRLASHRSVHSRYRTEGDQCGSRGVWMPRTGNDFPGCGTCGFRRQPAQQSRLGHSQELAASRKTARAGGPSRSGDCRAVSRGRLVGGGLRILVPSRDDARVRLVGRLSGFRHARPGTGPSAGDGPLLPRLRRRSKLRPRPHRAVRTSRDACWRRPSRRRLPNR